MDKSYNSLTSKEMFFWQDRIGITYLPTWTNRPLESLKINIDHEREVGKL